MTDKIIDPFTNVPLAEVASNSNENQGGTFLSDLRELSVGDGGSNIFHANKQGIWLGSDKFSTAPFSVNMYGHAIATSITVSGYITVGGAAADVNANTTTISGGKITTNSIDANKIVTGSLIVGTNVAIGTAEDAAGVTTIVGNTVTTSYVNALNVTAKYVVASVSLSSPTITGGTISIGSGNTIFKVDSNGLYLGNASFYSAPFRVDMWGYVTASGLTLTDAYVGSGSSYAGNQIGETYIANLSCSKITSGTFTVGGTSQPTAITILESSLTGNARFGFQHGSRMWEDSSSRIGINSIGTPFYIYVGSVQRIIIPNSGQTRIIDGVRLDGNLNVTAGYDERIEGGRLYVNTYNNYSEYLHVEGDGKFVGNLQTNHLDPRAANSYNCGGASLYWAYVNCHDVSYHSIGCYDDGVTIKKDGKLVKVSDVEAIKNIKPHATEKTKDGAPLIDKFSLPIEMFIPAADQDGKLYPRNSDNIPIVDKINSTIDKNKNEVKTITKEPMADADGESGAQLLGLLLGAIKELDSRIASLETTKKP